MTSLAIFLLALPGVIHWSLVASSPYWDSHWVGGASSFLLKFIHLARCAFELFPQPTLSTTLFKMSNLTNIRQLVKDISALSISLSDSVPKGTKDDKIWSVMNTEERETPHETFNYRFDALFAEDCRDPDGHLHYVRQGKLGMGVVVSYLSKINWAGFPLDIVELKLQRLLGELKKFQCVTESFVRNRFAHFD